MNTTNNPDLEAAYYAVFEDIYRRMEEGEVFAGQMALPVACPDGHSHEIVFGIQMLSDEIVNKEDLH